MMDNERRADLGREAVAAAATQTNVMAAEPALTAITDVVAYLARFCDRCRRDGEHSQSSTVGPAFCSRALR